MPEQLPNSVLHTSDVSDSHTKDGLAPQMANATLGPSPQAVPLVSGDAAETPLNDPIRMLDLIADSGISLHCDHVGRPQIQLPQDADPQRSEPYPLYSSRVKAWIQALARTELKKLISNSDIGQIQAVLEDMAHRSMRPEISLADAADESPLVAVVVARLERCGDFSGRCEDLYSELKRIAAEPGFELNAKEFPGSGSHLSQKLWKLRPLLECLNITIERGKRHADARFIALQDRGRRGVMRTASTTLPPARNSLEEHGLGAMDGNGDELDDLFGQIERPEAAPLHNTECRDA